MTDGERKVEDDENNSTAAILRLEAFNNMKLVKKAQEMYGIACESLVIMDSVVEGVEGYPRPITEDALVSIKKVNADALHCLG
jgi:hypothetical protein